MAHQEWYLNVYICYLSKTCKKTPDARIWCNILKCCNDGDFGFIFYASLN